MQQCNTATLQGRDHACPFTRASITLSHLLANTREVRMKTTTMTLNLSLCHLVGAYY